MVQKKKLKVAVLDRGFAWLDTGTFDNLSDASEYVRVIEKRQGLKIGCVEEAAWRAGFIDDAHLRGLAGPLEKSGYGSYLKGLIDFGEPGPGAPTERPFGFFFPHSMKSGMVLAGLSAGTVSMLIISKNVVTGAKPFTGSYIAVPVAGR